MHELLAERLELRAQAIEELYASGPNRLKKKYQNTLWGLFSIFDQQEFVTKAYQLVLRHSPDAQGLKHHLSTLAGPLLLLRRMRFLARLCLSPESLARTTAQLKKAILPAGFL